MRTCHEATTHLLMIMMSWDKHVLGTYYLFFPFGFFYCWFSIIVQGFGMRATALILAKRRTGSSIVFFYSKSLV